MRGCVKQRNLTQLCQEIYQRKLLKNSAVTVIFNAILKTFQYPRQWVIEQQIPPQKVFPASSEDQLRNIAKTNL